MTRRSLCSGCRRPVTACWCPYAQPVATPHRVIVLQHPREQRRALGSVRILRRVLNDVVVRVGVDFGGDVEVQAALADGERECVLLFPASGPRAFDLTAARRRPLTVFILDGTWTQARALRARNPWLDDLPYVRLSPAEPSVYGVCPQPGPGSLCTLEAVAHALAMAEDDEAIRDALLRPLRAMATMHLLRSYSPKHSPGHVQVPPQVS